LLARCIGEEIQLDGAARLRFGFAHWGIVALAGAASGRGRFLEVPVSSHGLLLDAYMQWFHIGSYRLATRFSQ
jgi:hypothetical protein